MDKRYQVFISSTFADLEEERKLVMEAILECNCFPAGMEMFPALDIDQFEYIKTIIDKSDYYILIVAGRYGSLAPDGIGYTEKEYKYAIEKKIPVLAFIKNDIESIPATHTDQDKDLKEKLIKFRKEILGKRLGKMWDDKYELQSNISLSLRAAFEHNPRIGWIRANEMITSKSDDISLVYEKINKDILMKINRRNTNEYETISVKLFDFIKIIGDFEGIVTSDDYILNVESYIYNRLKACIDPLSYSLFYSSGNGIDYSLSDINNKLKILEVASVSYTSDYRFYTISLTELGKNIYKNTILESI